MTKVKLPHIGEAYIILVMDSYNKKILGLKRKIGLMLYMQPVINSFQISNIFIGIRKPLLGHLDVLDERMYKFRYPANLYQF